MLACCDAASAPSPAQDLDGSEQDGKNHDVAKGLSECIASTKGHKSAKQVCEDFYNPNVGIAYQLGLSFPKRTKWNGPHQSVSITHSGKSAKAFEGAHTYWGTVFRLGSGSKFWKYFQVCKNSKALAAMPHDGFKCGEDQRIHVEKAGWSWEDWMSAKNAVVSQTKGHNYNEFNTRGTDRDAMAGIFFPKFMSRLPHLQRFSRRQACSKNGGGPIWEYGIKGGSSTLKVGGWC